MTLRRVLIGLSFIVLLLLGALIGLGGKEKEVYFKKSDTVLSSPQAEKEARPVRPVNKPPPGAFWFGERYRGMKPIGQKTGVIPGFLTLYAGDRYSRSIIGGGGVPDPIPFSVATYEGDHLATFDDLYSPSVINDRPFPRTRRSSEGYIAWFYLPKTDRTVVVGVAEPKRLEKSLRDLVES